MFFLTGCTNWTLVLEIVCAAVILFVVRSLTTRVQAHHRALDGIRKSLDEITRKLELLSPPAEAFENEDELEDLLDRAQLREAAPKAEAAPEAAAEEAAADSDRLKTAKLADLRDQCRSRGLSAGGSRADLIERLSGHVVTGE